MVQNLQNASGKTQKDLRTLALFIGVYCRGKRHEGRVTGRLNHLDTSILSKKPLCLCPECAKLLMHAIVKRTHCPHDPKPACKDCVTQCYSKAYKMQIREVMKYSGWRMLLSGRLDYLFHLLKRPQKSYRKPPAASQMQESQELVQIDCSPTRVPPN